MAETTSWRSRLVFISSCILILAGIGTAAITPIDEHGDAMVTMDTSTANLTLATDDRRDVTIYNNEGRRYPFSVEVYASNEDGIVTASFITQDTIDDTVDLTINRRSSTSIVLSLQAAQCITVCRETVTVRAENLETGTTEEISMDVLIERENQQVISSALLPTQLLVLVLGATIFYGLRRRRS